MVYKHDMPPSGRVHKWIRFYMLAKRPLLWAFVSPLWQKASHYASQNPEKANEALSQFHKAAASAAPFFKSCYNFRQKNKVRLNAFLTMVFAYITGLSKEKEVAPPPPLRVESREL